MAPESSVGDERSWSERHPRVVGAAIAVVASVAALLAIELALRTLFGFGNPILYDSNALYGYRPLPNQTLSRRFGAPVRVNNLGLRCDDDWTGPGDERVLFLGDSVTYGGNVANGELFSQLAMNELAPYRSCNAGVNAWGVENIHGLLVDSGFLPARYYVTVLIEDDFYRGLTRIHGQLVWCVKPALALEEALFDFLHVQDERRRYMNWRWYGTPEVVDAVLDRAVGQLADVDRALHAKGFEHLVYISPTRAQVLAGAPKDELVAPRLAKYGVRATYVLDAIPSVARDRAAQEALFEDDVHLTRAGHAAWASIINAGLRTLLAAKPVAGR